MLSKKIVEYLDKTDPESKPSLLWFENGKMIIGKVVKGEWVEKEGIKDPNHSGHRYIWKDEK